MSFLEILQAQPLLFVSCIAILGLCVGSFLNVIIYRLPKMLQQDWYTQCYNFLDIEEKKKEVNPQKFNLFFPLSHCPQCQNRLTLVENIPIISYCLQRGHCKSCKAYIPIKYLIIEVLSAIASAYVAWHFGFGLQAILAIVLTWVLICLAAIDLKHSLLPDDLTLPFMWLGFICNMFNIFTDLYSSLIGAMLGYMIFWSIFMIFKIATGKEGLGYGDFKLLALLGAWFGWQMLPLIILLSSILASLIGIVLIIFYGRDRQATLPFGPYLAIAGWVVLLWGKQLTSIYQASF